MAEQTFRRRIVWALAIGALVNVLLIGILFWMVLDLRLETSSQPGRSSTGIPILDRPARIPSRLPLEDELEDLRADVDRLRRCVDHRLSDLVC